MKKIKFFMMAICAIALASCGNKTQQQTEDQDTVKSFEQEQIEAGIRTQLDSIAGILGNLKQLPMLKDTKNGQIQLTEQEKQVKPDYLLDPITASDAVTLSEKYRVLTALSIDEAIAELYGMDVTAYNEATAKLAADINDPGFRIFAEGGDLQVESKEIYDAEVKAGRLNYFWQAVATSIVEQLYILEQNTDKFLPCFTDDDVANLTYRIAILQEAINRLTEYDPEIVEVAEAIKPLETLNAITVDDFKKELQDMSEQIVESRNQLVK